MDITSVATIVQVSIILLVAALLYELTRAMQPHFLRHWAKSWLLLAVGLTSLLISARVRPFSDALAIGFKQAYCLSEYLFGYFLWRGCREFHSPDFPIRRHYLLLGTLTLIGFALPLLFSRISQLFPLHAGILACFFAASAIECRSSLAKSRSIGLRVMLLSLYSLTLLFGHYCVLIGFYSIQFPGMTFIHLEYSSLYDATLEVGLAFGMVLLATERFRQEFEEKNAKLAAATIALEKTAYNDPLTGLLNRRAFQELHTTPKPIGQKGSIAMVDLNDLKPINDHYGHRTGDVALQLVARALQANSRVTDPIYRLGGDEFALVLPDCGPDELAERLSKVDTSLLGHRLPEQHGFFDVHISWGIAVYESPERFFAAVQLADELMYEQKKARKGEVRSRGEVSI